MGHQQLPHPFQKTKKHYPSTSIPTKEQIDNPLMSTESKGGPSKLQTRALEYLASTGSSNLNLRDGFLAGRRVQFVKGKHVVNALMRDSFSPKPSDPWTRDGAIALASSLLALGDASNTGSGSGSGNASGGSSILLRVERDSGSRQLRLAPLEKQHAWSEESDYLWLYQGNPIYRMAMAIGVLAIIFAGVLFPLWPPFMRQGVYYLSLLAMGLLGALMGLGVIRWILWLFLVLVLGRGGWLFPNLFADVGFFDSFKPVWEWEEKGAASHGIKSA